MPFYDSLIISRINYNINVILFKNYVFIGLFVHKHIIDSQRKR